MMSVEQTTSEPEEFFRLYDDPGLIRRVPHVEATVATWNIVTRQLALSNVTDQDPMQIDRVTGNTDISKFATSLVIGKTSGARWVSVSSEQVEKPFDDAKNIQDEFNLIKVYDQQDVNPFNFY